MMRYTGMMLPSLSRRERRHKARHHRRRHERLVAYVTAKLRLDWSPEAISGRLKVDYPDDDQMRISHETIYRLDLSGFSQQGRPPPPSPPTPQVPEKTKPVRLRKAVYSRPRLYRSASFCCRHTGAFWRLGRRYPGRRERNRGSCHPRGTKMPVSARGKAHRQEGARP